MLKLTSYVIESEWCSNLDSSHCQSTVDYSAPDNCCLNSLTSKLLSTRKHLLETLSSVACLCLLLALSTAVCPVNQLQVVLNVICFGV